MDRHTTGVDGSRSDTRGRRGAHVTFDYEYTIPTILDSPEAAMHALAEPAASDGAMMPRRNERRRP
jgi:hypothetical protein